MLGLGFRLAGDLARWSTCPEFVPGECGRPVLAWLCGARIPSHAPEAPSLLIVPREPVREGSPANTRSYLGRRADRLLGSKAGRHSRKQVKLAGIWQNSSWLDPPRRAAQSQAVAVGKAAEAAVRPHRENLAGRPGLLAVCRRCPNLRGNLPGS